MPSELNTPSPSTEWNSTDLISQVSVANRRVLFNHIANWVNVAGAMQCLQC